MTRHLHFSRVGRSKFSGQKLLHPEITTPDEIAEAAYDEARKHLMSRDVECIYDPAKNEGKIFAGFHNVGKFSVRKTKGD